MSADPQSWNPYSYVGNNPLSYTDSSGLGFWSDLFGAIASFFGFGGGGSFDLGSVFSCGGPLGNCGTLDNGPFSENPGLATVQDPGRFVMDLSSTAERLGCAADFGSSHSLAAGLTTLFPGISNNAPAKFIVGLFGGNTVSSLANLGLYLGGAKMPSATDLAKIPLKGVGQGIPLSSKLASEQFRRIWSGATGFARGETIKAGATAAYNGIRGVGQETIQLGLSNTVGTSVAGLTAETASNVATGVGFAKFGVDLGTFLYGVAKGCP